MTAPERLAAKPQDRRISSVGSEAPGEEQRNPGHGQVVLSERLPRRDDGVMSDVHQCPFCELRFVHLSELKFHIEMDHPDRTVPDRDH